MAKFYAVKNGFHIGIFNTWEECKREVNGFSGAEFKSFTSRSDAEAYIAGSSLNDDTLTADGTDCAVAYVDGSYNVKTAEYSYGAVVFYDGEEHHFSEKFSDAENALMRNVAGEINGSMRAMRFCIEENIPLLDLYYDYAGIEKWCTGEWKTNKSGTIFYKQYFDSISDKVKVRFHKVKGHSGDKYNDLADSLAKSALGIDI